MTLSPKKLAALLLTITGYVSYQLVYLTVSPANHHDFFSLVTASAHSAWSALIAITRFALGTASIEIVSLLCSAILIYQVFDLLRVSGYGEKDALIGIMIVSMTPVMLNSTGLVPGNYIFAFNIALLLLRGFIGEDWWLVLSASTVLTLSPRVALLTLTALLLYAVTHNAIGRTMRAYKQRLIALSTITLGIGTLLVTQPWETAALNFLAPITFTSAGAALGSQLTVPEILPWLGGIQILAGLVGLYQRFDDKMSEGYFVLLSFLIVTLASTLLGFIDVFVGLYYAALLLPVVYTSVITSVRTKQFDERLRWLNASIVTVVVVAAALPLFTLPDVEASRPSQETVDRARQLDQVGRTLTHPRERAMIAYYTELSPIEYEEWATAFPPGKNPYKYPFYTDVARSLERLGVDWVIITPDTRAWSGGRTTIENTPCVYPETVSSSLELYRASCALRVSRASLPTER